MNSLTLTIKTPPLIFFFFFLHFPLEFTLEKPFILFPLLFIFWGFKPMHTSFLNLRKGRFLIKKANNPFQSWAALLKIRNHSIWNTTWKVVGTKLQVISYNEEVKWAFFFFLNKHAAYTFPRSTRRKPASTKKEEYQPSLAIESADSRTYCRVWIPVLQITAVWTWASYFSLLCLSLPVYKMRKIIIVTTLYSFNELGFAGNSVKFIKGFL